MPSAAVVVEAVIITTRDTCQATTWSIYPGVYWLTAVPGDYVHPSLRVLCF